MSMTPSILLIINLVFDIIEGLMYDVYFRTIFTLLLMIFLAEGQILADVLTGINPECRGYV